MATEQAGSAHCIACGVRLAPDTRFCTSCGAQQKAAAAPAPPAFVACRYCGGGGRGLPAELEYCPHCRWLRPLIDGYRLDPGVYLWRLDGEAMIRLQSSTPLNALANQISDRVGRPWFEAAVNGVRLGEDQLPDLFAYAVRAARIAGLGYLPEIYVSGENMWDAVTMGSATGAFVSIGSVLTNLRGTDLLYLLGREMGHAAAGHALWRTVVEFAAGKRGPSSLVGRGFLEYLNPAKIVEGAIQAPLLAWKRHSEITADRAGLLLTGDLESAARVLSQWTLKSFPLYARINQEAWRRQEDYSDDATIRISEFLMTATPYLARRLRMLREFERTEAYRDWRRYIEHCTRGLPDFEAGEGGGRGPPGGDLVRIRCAACKKTMRVPRSMLEGDGPVNIRCPNRACRKVMAVKPRRRREPGVETMTDG